ncbi:MAG: hypothetical protein ACRELB_13595, partial [Polyangiaceae bacterium]
VLTDTLGTYAANDTFRVQVTSGQVTYLQNGSLLYTSSHSAKLPLVVDASLYTTGATVQAVTLSTPSTFWQNEVGVTDSGSSLTKTAADGWDAGASTVGSLTGNGYVEFTTAEATKHKMAGLTHTVTDSSFDTIDFAFFLYADGSLYIYEDGAFAQAVGTYAAGDVLRVQVTGTTVTYLKNGTLLYTSSKSATLPLVLDTSLYSTGATIDNVTLNQPSTFWQNEVGVNDSGSSITKTAADGWDSGASTISSLSGSGYVEFTTAETSTHKMAGLTHTVTDSGFADIDFAFFLYADGSLYVYEDGAFAQAVGTYTAGDVLRVQVTGTQVTYLKNGTLLYTSASTATLPLVFDASLYTTGATVQNVTFSP